MNMAGGNHDGDRLLTLPEVADGLRVSVKTVRRLIDEGKLQSIKVRGVRRVWLGGLKSYLASLEPASC
jgi:excisionase family DNA binding protein